MTSNINDIMSASEKEYSAERLPLADAVPLSAPLSVHFSPTNLCNFRCFYCQHGNKEQHKRMRGTMNFSDFEKALSNILTIGVPKKIIFAGLGEPLLNGSITDMVGCASKKTSVAMLTNASLLNEEVSTKLINAGLDEIRISLQGLNDAQYEQVCGVKLDFERLIRQIRYFYEHRGKCKVNVKIIDRLLENERASAKYFDVFSEIADSVNIESLIPTNNLVSDTENGYEKTLKGGDAKERVVCPLPFYQIVVNYNGDIHAGCSDKNATFGCPVIGNAILGDMASIWNVGKHYDLCMSMLNGRKASVPECRICNDYKYQGSDKDTLDEKAEEICSRMGKRENL